MAQIASRIARGNPSFKIPKPPQAVTLGGTEVCCLPMHNRGAGDLLREILHTLQKRKISGWQLHVHLMPLPMP